LSLVAELEQARAALAALEAKNAETALSLDVNYIY
jgi:hypothetical protein